MSPAINGFEALSLIARQRQTGRCRTTCSRTMKPRFYRSVQRAAADQCPTGPTVARKAGNEYLLFAKSW